MSPVRKGQCYEEPKMKAASGLSICFFILAGVLLLSLPAGAQVSLGKGNLSLLGGDLTDPEDKIAPSTENIGRDMSEAALEPPNATWVKMTCSPANGPGTPPHQRHPYQSWQGAPACAVFLNRSQKMKWYLGFKEGGYGGPTRAVRFATVGQWRPGQKGRRWSDGDRLLSGRPRVGCYSGQPFNSFV